jgi:WD40 repeat protein
VGRIPENGGALDTLLSSVITPRRFTKVPGHPVLLFTIRELATDDTHVLALNTNTGGTATVAAPGTSPTWSATGHVLFARDEGSLFAVAFDPRTMRASGTPVPVLDGISATVANARYSLSPEGTLVYVAGPSTAGPTYRLVLDDLEGVPDTLPLPSSVHWDARFSPDGRRIAYVRNDHVWVYDTDLGTQTQLTRQGTRHHNPVWSPDGNRLAYAAQGDSGQGVEVFAKDAGRGAIERYAGSADDEYPAQWLPDGTVLVLRSSEDRTSCPSVAEQLSSVTPVLGRLGGTEPQCLT